MTKVLWVCTVHKTEIHGRKELSQHLKDFEGCSIYGDQEDD